MRFVLIVHLHCIVHILPTPHVPPTPFQTATPPDFLLNAPGRPDSPRDFFNLLPKLSLAAETGSSPFNGGFTKPPNSSPAAEEEDAPPPCELLSQFSLSAAPSRGLR